MIDALEKAVELEPIPQVLTILADAYDRAGQSELAHPLREKVNRMLVPTDQPGAKLKSQRPKQPRKIIM